MSITATDIVKQLSNAGVKDGRHPIESGRLVMRLREDGPMAWAEMQDESWTIFSSQEPDSQVPPQTAPEIARALVSKFQGLAVA